MSRYLQRGRVRYSTLRGLTWLSTLFVLSWWGTAVAATEVQLNARPGCLWPVMWISAGVLFLLAVWAGSAGWLRATERRVLRRISRAMFQGGWLGVLIALLIGLASCEREVERAAAAMTGGEPGRGQQVIQQYGCASCHTIPGIPGAHALVGPSLEHIASRMYIAGVLPNTPEHMLRWLQSPLAVDPLTAMPNLGVTEADARDIAGYLYTLR